MNSKLAGLPLVILLLFMALIKVNCQSVMPDVMNKGSVREQLKYIEEKTLIYENYRAIREDVFQKLKANVSDTLSSAGSKISGLNISVSDLRRTIDSLSSSLETTRTNLADMTRTKNSITLLGIEINKTMYNTIMWAIIAGLLVLLAMGFLILKRNISVTQNTKKELTDLKAEFEAYRKTSREAREKMSMSHFLELKKLKGE